MRQGGPNFFSAPGVSTNLNSPLGEHDFPHVYEERQKQREAGIYLLIYLKTNIDKVKAPRVVAIAIDIYIYIYVCVCVCKYVQAFFFFYKSVNFVEIGNVII